MLRWFGRTSLFIGCFFAGFVGLSLPAHAQELLQGRQLVTALRDGGYILYLRHAATSRETIDRDPVNYHDRRTQRNLSDKGRSQARAIGVAMRRLDIPIAPAILASPYCRCVETARLAFGGATVSYELAFAIKMDEAETRRRAGYLKTLLGTPPPIGTNVALVAHTANLKEASNYWPKPEGVIMIFKPGLHGEFTYVGRLEPQEWTALAEQYGRKNVLGDATSQVPRAASEPSKMSVTCEGDLSTESHNLDVTP